MKVSLLIASFFLVLTSCHSMKKNTNEPATNSEIVDKHWELVEINGKPITNKFDKVPFIELNATEKRINGTGGCNSIFGGFELNTKKEEITFSSLATTQMACQLESLDQQLSIVLSQANRFATDGKTLWLKDGSKTLAKFSFDESFILNGAWQLTHMPSSKMNFAELFPESKPHLNFQLADEKVSGNGGCNTFNSHIEIQGKKIKFGPIAATRMACQGEGETEFLKTLQGINRFHVDNETLTLFKGDLLLMKFERIK